MYALSLLSRAGWSPIGNHPFTVVAIGPKSWVGEACALQFRRQGCLVARLLSIIESCSSSTPAAVRRRGPGMLNKAVAVIDVLTGWLRLQEASLVTD